MKINIVVLTGLILFFVSGFAAAQNSAQQDIENTSLHKTVNNGKTPNDGEVSYFCDSSMKPYSSEFYQDFITASYCEQHSKPWQAFEIYECLAQIAPKEKSILASLAGLSIDISMQTKHNDTMIKHIPVYYAANPESPTAKALMAELLWSQDKYPEALSFFEEALKKDPENPQIMSRYITLLKQEYPDKEIVYLKSLAETYPRMGYWIPVEIANFYLARKDSASAINFLEQYIANNHFFAEPYLALASVYESNRKTDDALRIYMEMEKQGFASADILVKIGAYYTLKEDKQKALSYFKKAKALDKANPAAAQFLILDAQARGDYDSAAKYIRESSTYQKEPALHIKEAYFLSRAGKMEEAAEILQQAHKNFPDDMEVSVYCGLALMDVKDYDEAEKLFAELVENHPENEVALLQYAYALDRQKKYKKMESYLKKLLEVNPQNADGLNFYGYYLIDKTNRLEEGGNYAKTAVSINSKEPAYIDSLAWYYYKKGNYAQAYELLNSIAQEDISLTEDFEIYLHLAQTAQALKKYEEASLYYKKVLQAEPKNKTALKNLKKLNKLLK